MHKKLKALQALCRTQIDSLNSAIPHLEPALAKQFTDLRAQFQEALDGFPAAAGDNDADAKAEVDGLYSCLTKSHELFISEIQLTNLTNRSDWVTWWSDLIKAR